MYPCRWGGVVIRDALNRLLTPLARPLVNVAPNTISAFALVSGCIAGVAYWLTNHHSVFYFVGAVLAVVSGVADAVDGIVARMTGSTSRMGDFLDHVYDRIVDIAIVVGMSLSPNADALLGLSVAVAVLFNGYLGTQIHASFGARHYSGLGKGQLLAALVLVSLVLGIAPQASVHVVGRDVAVVNAFFALVGLFTIPAVVHRIRLGVRLARSCDGSDDRS